MIYSVLSPCNSNCKIHSVDNLCSGCYRTMDEIVKWWQMSNEDKLKVLEMIENRKNQVRNG